MKNIPRRAVVNLLPVVSGLLAASTLPPFNISAASWVFLIPLLFFIEYTRSTKKVFYGGLVVGIIYFIKVVYPLFSLNAWWWFDVSNIVIENRYLFLFWVLYFLVLYSSLFFGLFAVAFKKIRTGNVIDMVLFSFLWVFFEFVRTATLYWFSWGNIGYAVHDNLYILQVAKLAGVYGVSFVVAFVNIAVFIAARSWLLNNKKSIRYSFLAVITLLFSVYLYGYVVLKDAPSTIGIKVVVFQPGIKTEEITISSSEKDMAELVDSVSGVGARIIVFPENMFPFLTFDRGTMMPVGYEERTGIKNSFDMLVAMSRGLPSTTFIFGAYSIDNTGKYNSVLMLSDGVLKVVYDKKLLMPFSERGVFFIDNATGLVPGELLIPTTVDGRLISYLICSEISSSPQSILQPDDGVSDIIINIGNDGVFDSQTVAEQNHIIARFYAVSESVFVIRAMKTGVSSIIAPSGEVLRSIKNGEGLLFSN